VYSRRIVLALLRTLKGIQKTGDRSLGDLLAKVKNLLDITDYIVYTMLIQIKKGR
jgi:hypothetical protein